MNLLAQRFPEIDDLNERAWSAQYTDPALTLQLAVQSLELATRAEYPPGIAYALLNRAFYELRFRPLDQAESSLTDAGARFKDLDDKRGMLLVQTGLGALLLKQYRYHDAKQVLEQVLDAPDQDRIPLDAYFALYRLGYIHFYFGEIQEGLRYYYRALALAQRERSTPLSCQALSDLGSAQMELQNYEEARALLEQAYSICKTMQVCFAHLIYGNLASVHLETGNVEAALQIVENDFPLTGEYFQLGEKAFLDVVASQALAGVQRWDEAWERAARALPMAEADGHAEVANQCLWMLGVISRGRGAFKEAIHWLQEAERGFSHINNVFYVLHVYRSLADTFADLRQYESAYRYALMVQQHYEKSLGASSRARYYTLQIQYELTQAEFERDYALQQQIKLEHLNAELRFQVNEIAQLQTALREQATRDPLTGLYNRRYLNEQILPMLDQAERSGQTLCVALIDLDHFKSFNDRYGHGFGDEVLIRAAHLLSQQIRSSDLAVRYGGEEFCLVFPIATASDAQLRLEAILDAFRACVIEIGDKVQPGLTFSAGIAEYPRHGDCPDNLLHTADMALYRAKHQGRNLVLCAD